MLKTKSNTFKNLHRLTKKGHNSLAIRRKKKQKKGILVRQANDRSAGNYFNKAAVAPTVVNTSRDRRVATSTPTVHFQMFRFSRKCDRECTRTVAVPAKIMMWFVWIDDEARGDALSAWIFVESLIDMENAGRY